QAEDGIRDLTVTGVQTCALPIFFRLCPRALPWAEGARAFSPQRESPEGALFLSPGQRPGFPNGTHMPRTAFLFPGQGAQTVGMEIGRASCRERAWIAVDVAAARG